MKNKRGFTLIEVLAGFLIVSIMSVSMTAIILNGITTTADKRARIVASSVAEYYVQTVKSDLKIETLINSYSQSKVVSYSHILNEYDEKELIENSTSLIDSSSPEYISDNLNDYKKTTIYKSLFSEGFTLDSITYNAENVDVRIGVKMATANGDDYKIGYVAVIIEYYEGRTLEVIRDVY